MTTGEKLLSLTLEYSRSAADRELAVANFGNADGAPGRDPKVIAAEYETEMAKLINSDAS